MVFIMKIKSIVFLYLEMEVESLLYLPIKITHYGRMKSPNCFNGNIYQSSVLVFQLEGGGEGRVEGPARKGGHSVTCNI